MRVLWPSSPPPTFASQCRFQRRIASGQSCTGLPKDVAIHISWLPGSETALLGALCLCLEGNDHEKKTNVCKLSINDTQTFQLSLVGLFCLWSHGLRTEHSSSLCVHSCITREDQTPAGQEMLWFQKTLGLPSRSIPSLKLISGVKVRFIMTWVLRRE